MLCCVVLAKQIAEEIQCVTIGGDDSQTVQLNKHWKDLFLDYLFKSWEKLHYELKKEILSARSQGSCYQILSNMGMLFMY